MNFPFYSPDNGVTRAELQTPARTQLLRLLAPRENKVTRNRTSGTEYLGSVPWGTHFCEFHSIREELADTLVPYFAAGLQHDEFCLWVTSDPAGVQGRRQG
jgi:hypothetical protein